MLKISQQYNRCKKWLVVLTTEWLPWLQTSWRDSGHERFILVLEANCINNLNPNHTLQLTTFRTSVRESLQLHFKHMMAFVVTLSQMFSGYYISKIMHWLWNALWCKKLWLFHRCSVVTISPRSCVGYGMLFDTRSCDTFTDVQWLLTARSWL